jgi:hypothetical protein
MGRRPFTSRAMPPLVAAMVVLPIAISVLLGVSALLTAMNDSAGGVVLRYIALGCGTVWVVGLVCLVLLQGLRWLDDPPPRDEPGRPHEDE